MGDFVEGVFEGAFALDLEGEQGGESYRGGGVGDGSDGGAVTEPGVDVVVVVQAEGVAFECSADEVLLQAVLALDSQVGELAEEPIGGNLLSR